MAKSSLYKELKFGYSVLRNNIGLLKEVRKLNNLNNAWQMKTKSKKKNGIREKKEKNPNQVVDDASFQ